MTPEAIRAAIRSAWRENSAEVIAGMSGREFESQVAAQQELAEMEMKVLMVMPGVTRAEAWSEASRIFLKPLTV